MIDSNFLAVVAVAASMKTVVAASCHHHLGLAFGIEVQQLEQRRQPVIAAAVIDVVADAEAFVALQLMTMRVDVVVECPVVK